MLVPGGEYQLVVMQNAAAATGNGVEVVCVGAENGAMSAITMQLSGTFAATVTFEATVNGSNWIAVAVTNLNDGVVATTATAAGLYRLTCLGLAQVRARVSAYTSGNVTVTGIAVA